MANLGFVGLGLMGSRIVKRLLDTGHQVTSYNRTRAKADALRGAGMQWRDAPREVAKAAVSLTILKVISAALSSVADGKGGVLTRMSGMSEA